jgi:large subunit ribosomal protein L21
MYAVIKTGGKQHKVKAGDVIEVEYIHGADDGLTFKPLLVVDDDGKTHVGKDLDKAVVKAKAAGEQKGEKVRIFKYKNKTGYSRRQGHRQLLTLLEISDVSLDSGAAKKTVSTKDEVPAEAEASAES